MTTNYHTPISVGEAANAATFNTPLSELDAAIEAGIGLIQLTNKSGGALAANDCIIVDGANDEAVTTTTTAGDTNRPGIVLAGGANDAEISISLLGEATVVVDGAGSRGDWIKTSTTAKQVTPVASLDEGVFGILTSDSSGGAGTTATALLLGTVVASASAATSTLQGIVELATDAETQTGTDTARATTPASVASAYYKQGQHINTSAGAGDAGKPVVLNADGRIDSTMLGILAGSNLLINGGFDHWQRSTDDTGVTTTRKYVADRWAVTTGASTLSHVQRSTTVRSGARSRYSMQLDGAASVTTVDVDQRIEASLSGLYKTTISFSAWVYNGSGSAFTPKLFVSTPSAEDDWSSSTVRNGGGSGEDLQECADSQWTNVTWTADVSGYTDIDNGLEVRLQIPSGSLVASDTIRLAEMNLVADSVPAAFSGRLPMIEEALCQRYFLAIGGPAYTPVGTGIVSAADVVSGIILTPVTMHKAPSITGGGMQLQGSGTTESITSITNLDAQSNGISADFNNNTSPFFGTYVFHITKSDGSDVLLSAEL